ncbi:hypothetical protein JVT61DRAFT_12031 [Boletus reticuloceps]|uniref:Uncharacterized protein n=1 Tax=Boletus reticuloceps TaxID=495285 RepID=A0A8I2YEE1_9AGAM|nr:hypothetical protein JVT61DRAFT_12031 [Boletus reticuloceps]
MLLEDEPKTSKEETYQEALRAAYSREEEYKSVLHSMQSTVVLQSIYCDKLSEQLVAQEEVKKAKKKGQLVGDGLPRLLTGDEFYKRVVNHKKAMEDEKVASEIRRKQKEQQSNLFLAWKEADDARKKRNKEQKTAYHQQLALWNHEQEQAKTERRRVSWVKPKLGKLEAPLPKPGSRSIDEVEVAGDEGNDGNLDEGTDMGMDSSGEDGEL